MKTTMTISSENFKRAVKAAVSCCAKNGYVSALWHVYMDIGRNGAFMATNLDQYVRCTFDANAAGGEDTLGICVDSDLVKKIVNTKGDKLTFTYDTEKEREVKLSNGKKIITLACYPVDNSAGSNDFNRESFSIPFEMDREEIMKVDSEELLTAVKNTAVFKSERDDKPILKGFHFNGADNMIETVDGYHCVRKDWKSGTMNADYCETVGGCLENIKNVFSKSDSTIQVFGVEYKESKLKFDRYKYTMFSGIVDGMTIEYAVRNLQGEFMDIKKSYPASFSAVGTVKTGTLMELCKEYARFISPKEVNPIVFSFDIHKVYAGLKTQSVSFCEPVDMMWEGTPLLAGYKNAYLMDALSVFDKNETIAIKANSNIQPILLENGEYHVLVLPVRLEEFTKEWFKRDIAALTGKKEAV